MVLGCNGSELTKHGIDYLSPPNEVCEGTMKRALYVCVCVCVCVCVRPWTQNV